jgi:hypothetical protein
MHADLLLTGITMQIEESNALHTSIALRSTAGQKVLEAMVQCSNSTGHCDPRPPSHHSGLLPWSR